MFGKTIGEISGDAAAAFGDKTALIFAGKALSFAEIDRLSSRVASGLREIGVAAGDRVTLYAQNSVEWIVSYYAVAKAGGVINPINVMLTPDEVAYVVKDCGAKALFTTADRAAPIRSLKEDGHLAEIVVFGEADGVASFDSLAAAGSEDFAPVKADPESLSTICYTSGTTGFPKGAMLSHRSVILNAAVTAAMNMRTSHDVQLTALPCAHVYGGTLMNLNFLFGSTLVLYEKFDAGEALQGIQDYRATVTDGVPTMYFYMLAHPGFEKFDLSSLQRCVTGGQTMPVAKAEEWRDRAGCEVYELWGMTELAGPGLMQHCYGENRLGSVGIEMFYHRARIVDPEDASKELPPGEVGELMFRGPFVMMGYYRNETATRETIEPDGWLHSGDLGKVDEDGYFYIVDRKKDMILTAGFNIYPAEIERVISAHPAVAMVGVGARKDEAKGEVAKAYVVLKPDGKAGSDELIGFCRDRLAAYKVPREVQIVADLPTTSTGKILRRELHTLEAG